MKDYIPVAKTFITTHRKKIVIGAEITLSIAVIATAVMLFLYNMPKDTYQAVKACDLFTPAEAQNLLGEKVISVDMKAPVISDDIATSKCSYTDSNTDKDKMIVAAIAVRSGINNKGVQQNKTDFADNTPTEGAETVKNLGDSAYFNKAQGQLNVLDGRKWMILSYGVGSAPQDNKLDKAIELAKKVLH
jgi:hypothetical protein